MEWLLGMFPNIFQAKVASGSCILLFIDSSVPARFKNII